MKLLYGWRRVVWILSILCIGPAYGSSVSCPYDANAEWPAVPDKVCQSVSTDALLLDDNAADPHPECRSGDSDPDGDGWGWENQRSCRVARSVPVCSDDASDPDGDGWGWENKRSCFVALAKASRAPVCQSRLSDQDGDGWGFEKGVSCQVTSATPHVVCSPDTIDPDGDGWGYENNRSCLIVEAKRAVDIVFQQDFEQTPPGQYRAEQLNRDWHTPLWHLGFVQGRVKIVSEAARGNVMQVTYPANKYGAGGAAAFLSDLELGVDLPRSYEELYLSYDVKFGEGFEFVKGGKLPGLCGYDNNRKPVHGCNTGGGFPSGYDGWSTRGMWRQNGELENYVYHASQKSFYGDDLFWQVKAEPGSWHRVQHRVLLNTPGVANGVLEAWIDGQKVLSADNLMYRKTADIGINLFYFSTFYGGNDPSWAPATDQFMYFDNFRIATQPENLALGRSIALNDPVTEAPASGGGGAGLAGLLLLTLTRWFCRSRRSINAGLRGLVS